MSKADEKIPDKVTEEEVWLLRAFKREWSERFGFLAIDNPRDSFESIDEVATILFNERQNMQNTINELDSELKEVYLYWSP